MAGRKSTCRFHRFASLARPVASLGAAVLAAALAGCASDAVPGYRPVDGLDTALIRTLAADPRLICGAGTPLDLTGASKHIIVVDPRGDGEKISDNLPDTGNYEKQFKNITSAYVRFRNSAPPGSPNRVLIYVNGGLNPKKTVLKQAREQIPCMKAAGYFPVFLIWRTGAFETYAEQIGKVRNGRLEEDWQLTAPLYFVGDIGQGISRSPTTYINQMKLFAGAQDSGNSEYSLKNHIWRHDPARHPARDNNLLFEDRVDERSADTAGFVLYGLTMPFRALVTPFLDAFGKTAWENMVRRSRITVRRVGEFRESAGGTPPVNNTGYQNGTAPFSKFFADLQDCYQPAGGAGPPAVCKGDPGTAAAAANMKLTVIGHSMGTIVLNALIPLFDRLDFRKIVYMGAAASIRDFNRSVVPLIERNPKIRFFNLSLHPLAEAREVDFFGAVPSGSLLEWIDDMFEGPKTMLDRTLGKWRNVRLAKHVFPAEAQKRMIFKVFGFREQRDRRGHAGYRPGDPVMHGQFNDTHMYYWLPEFWGERDINWP